MKNWEEEFDKNFVRDDGLMDKYYVRSFHNSDFMAVAIKSFINQLLTVQKKELINKILIRLYILRASIPPTFAGNSRTLAKELIEELNSLLEKEEK